MSIKDALAGAIREQAAEAVPALTMCGCIGPQNGEPRCPCAMRHVIVRDGRYIQKEVDLGPAPAGAGMTKGLL